MKSRTTLPIKPTPRLIGEPFSTAPDRHGRASRDAGQTTCPPIPDRSGRRRPAHRGRTDGRDRPSSAHRRARRPTARRGAVPESHEATPANRAATPIKGKGNAGNAKRPWARSNAGHPMTGEVLVDRGEERGWHRKPGHRRGTRLTRNRTRPGRRSLPVVSQSSVGSVRSRSRLASPPSISSRYRSSTYASYRSS